MGEVIAFPGRHRDGRRWTIPMFGDRCMTFVRGGREWRARLVEPHVEHEARICGGLFELEVDGLADAAPSRVLFYLQRGVGGAITAYVASWPEGHRRLDLFNAGTSCGWPWCARDRALRERVRRWVRSVLEREWTASGAEPGAWS